MKYPYKVHLIGIKPPLESPLRYKNVAGCVYCYVVYWIWSNTRKWGDALRFANSQGIPPRQAPLAHATDVLSLACSRLALVLAVAGSVIIYKLALKTGSLTVHENIEPFGISLRLPLTETVFTKGY